MSIADKLNLALTTKSQIKEKLRISDNVYSHYPSIVQKYVDNNPTKTSTDGVCNDALALPIYDFKLVGNTIQNTTKGINLLYIQDMSVTINGVTATVLNGKITLTGTLTQSVSLDFPLDRVITIPAGTYTLWNGTDNNPYPYASLMYDNSKPVAQVFADNGIKVFTLNSDLQINKVRFWITTLTIESYRTFTPAVYSGSYTKETLPAYEPYTGLIPSPSPDYKQPMTDLVGNVTVKQDAETITTINLTSPLRKIGDVADYVDFQNKKIVRKIGKVTLDSSVNVTVFGGSTYEFRAYAGTNVKNGGAVKCNVLQSSTADIMWGKRNTAGYNLIATTSGNSFLIMINDLTTASAVKSKLAELNTEILYELAEPIEEDMTLPDIELEEGDNTFTADSNITANWEIKYIIDKDVVLEEIQTAMLDADIDL